MVTFQGPCDHPQKTPGAKGCKITLTRADIDALINALEPTSASPVRRKLALDYSRLAAAAAAAEGLHLEKNPAIVEQINMQQKLVRMQVLANALYSQIEARSNNVPSAEVERYYADHQPDFVRGDIRRVTIPKSFSVDTQQADIVALKTLADSYQARAAAGEDIDQLQQEVVKNLALKLNLPPTKINMPRPANLLVAERGVFALEPGQVTPVLESSAAFTILKLDSKQSIPLDIAQTEIITLLQREHAQKEILKVTASANAQFNLKYFGLLTAPEILPPPQVAGVAPDQNSQSSMVQRAPARRSMMPRKR